MGRHLNLTLVAVVGFALAGIAPLFVPSWTTFAADVFRNKSPFVRICV